VNKQKNKQNIISVGGKDTKSTDYKNKWWVQLCNSFDDSYWRI